MNRNYLDSIRIGLTTFDGCHPRKKYSSSIRFDTGESCHILRQQMSTLMLL